MRLFNFEINKVNKKSLSNNYWLDLSLLFDNDVTFSKATFFELYTKNSDIRECVRKIAWAVARNGIYLLDNNKQIVEDNKVTEEVLNLFKTPTFAKFKVNLFRNYDVSWELYIKPIKNALWVTIRMDVLDSRQVDKVISDWVITNYRVTDWHKTQVYPADQIAYFKYEDDIRYSLNGMWVLTSIMYDAVTDLEASKNNYFFYKNSARPDMMLLLNDWMSIEEQQNAKEMFDAQFKGSNNAHKTIVWWWIKEIKQISLSSSDMETIAHRKLSTDKICSAFGVPKPLLWYIDWVNYNNGSNAKEEFLEWTVKSCAEDFDAILNKCLQMFRPDLFEKYWIKSDSEQLKETQEWYKWQREDVANWIITINEARIDRWLEPLKDENADKPMVSRNAVLLEDITLDAVLPWDEI